METNRTNGDNIESDINNKCISREEYINKLSKWLEDARLWHGFCASFPYYMYVQNQNLNDGSVPFPWPNDSVLRRRGFQQPDNQNVGVEPGKSYFC